MEGQLLLRWLAWQPVGLLLAAHGGGDIVEDAGAGAAAHAGAGAAACEDEAASCLDFVYRFQCPERRAPVPQAAEVRCAASFCTDADADVCCQESVLSEVWYDFIGRVQSMHVRTGSMSHTLEEMFHFAPGRQVLTTWPVRGQMFADAEVSDLRCDFVSPAGVSWPALRRLAWQAAEADIPDGLRGVCARSTQDFIGGGLGMDRHGFFQLTPLFGLVSDWMNDCYFGMLTYVLLAMVCQFGGQANHNFPQAPESWAWWLIFCWQLEGIFQYLRLPLLALAAAPWPVTQLLSRVSAAIRSLPDGPPNECDDLELPEESAFLEVLRAYLAGGLTAHTALPAMINYLQTNRYSDRQKRCSFPTAMALVAINCVMLQRDHEIGLEGGRPVSPLLDAHQLLGSVWMWKRPTYWYYDIMTTKWPIWETIACLLPGLLPQALKFWNITFEQRLAMEGFPWAHAWPEHSDYADDGVDGCTEGTDALPAVSFEWPWHYEGEHVRRARCGLRRAGPILFISTWPGSELMHSYAMRAKQVARGLRRLLGVEAYSSLCGCTMFCMYMRQCLLIGRCRAPAVVVHVKGTCDCAAELFPKASGVVHVLDPIDRYALIPPVHEGPPATLAAHREVTALLAETSLSAADYASSPSVRAFGWRVFHLPHHHTNFERRAVRCRDEPRIVGYHSSMLEPELARSVEQMLADRFPSVSFRHLTPGIKGRRSDTKRSLDGQWGATVPQEILEEMLEFDVSFVKPNCYMPGEDKNDPGWRAWFCERLHGGQRLVHALAAGVPTVVWGTAQGLLDVVAPSPGWPLAISDEELVAHLAQILQNRTLRCKLAQEAQVLAEPYHLTRTVERYVLLFWELAQSLRRGGS